MSEEPQEERSEEGTGTPDLGARLVRRAVLPGVSTPGLDRDLAARGGPRTGGLAAEIRRRWLPAGAVGGRGPALPYFGGWPGGAGGSAAGAAGTAGSAGAAGGAAPMARTVATSSTPAAQASEALSGLGAELQLRHSAGMAGGGMVRRKTASGASAPAPSPVAPNTAAQNTVVQIPAGPGGGSSPLGGGGLGQGGGPKEIETGGGSLIHRSPASQPGGGLPVVRARAVQRSPASTENGGGLLAGKGATSSLTTGPAPLLAQRAEGPPPPPAAGFPAGEISVQPMIRRAPADNLEPAILRRKALPAEPQAVNAAPAAGGAVISREAVMPLASTGVADGTVARTAGTAGTTRTENTAPATTSAPVTPSFTSPGTAGAAPVAMVAEMGPAIRRRSTGAPAALPLAELRRKALGSEDEEEAAGTVQRTPATAPSAQPAGPLPHRASPAPSSSPAIQSLPPGPGLLPPGVASSAAQLVQRSVAPASPSLPSLSSFAPPGPASPPGMSQAASGIAMPLARVAHPGAGQAGTSPGAPGAAHRASPGLIQRAEASSGDAGAQAPAATPPATASPAATAGPASGSETNEDELAERVLRRLMRTLAVEGERRGLRRWP